MIEINQYQISYLKDLILIILVAGMIVLAYQQGEYDGMMAICGDNNVSIMADYTGVSYICGTPPPNPIYKIGDINGNYFESIQ